MTQSPRCKFWLPCWQEIAQPQFKYYFRSNFLPPFQLVVLQGWYKKYPVFFHAPVKNKNQMFQLCQESSMNVVNVTIKKKKKTIQYFRCAQNFLCRFLWCYLGFVHFFVPLHLLSVLSNMSPGPHMEAGLYIDIKDTSYSVIPPYKIKITLKTTYINATILHSKNKILQAKYQILHWLHISLSENQNSKCYFKYRPFSFKHQVLIM